MSFVCYECADRHRAAMYPVGDRYLCEPCAEKVRDVLDDGSELPQPGRLLFSDLSVDPSSGQITLRAELPNPDGMLLPGQYVRVRLAQATLPAAVKIPQQAVTRTQQGDTVLVVYQLVSTTNREIGPGSQLLALDHLKGLDRLRLTDEPGQADRERRIVLRLGEPGAVRVRQGADNRGIEIVL